MVGRKEIRAASAKFAEERATKAHAVRAGFDRAEGLVFVELSTGVRLSFPPGKAQGLENATASDLEEIEISPSGFGLHFPRLRADLYVPGLVNGVFGTKAWMASLAGAEGGSRASEAKAAAARANGKLGGRPRKAVQDEPVEVSERRRRMA